MIDEKRDTISDVLADFRQYVSNTKIPPEVAETIVCYLDRIKAAANREKAEIEADALAVGGIVEAARRSTAEKLSAVGNAAAMREALVAVKKSIDGIGKSSLDSDPTILMVALTQVCARLSARIERALSAPARNCDVGTAEEQGNRMWRFCAKQKRNGIINCGYCQIKHQYERDCTLDWAQMPYEAQEGGAK